MATLARSPISFELSCIARRKINESIVEDAALAWLESLGHAALHGPDIAVGMQPPSVSTRMSGQPSPSPRFATRCCQSC
jgi:hypothetical protein